MRRAELAPRLRGGRFAGGCDALLVLADVLGESALLSLSSAGQGLPGPDAALGIERRKPHRSYYSLLMLTFSLTQKHNRSYLPSKVA